MTTSSLRPAGGRPQTAAAPASSNGRLTARQYVRFAFYKVDPLWRRLPPVEQAAHKQELLDVIDNFKRRMLLRPYTTMGTRADAELLLWQIAETMEPFQELATAILRTRMGGYLNLTHSFLSQTKRSIYQIRVEGGAEEQEERLVIQPSDARYLFVYPFVKTRAWYKLSLPARQGIMDEHIVVGRKYPSVKLNTTYSFGLDDQEFVVAFETDEPADFLDLVQDLRETESSLYTLQDTPLFSCINRRLVECLDALGGPPIARPLPAEAAHDSWTDVCPREDLAEGESRIVYLDGQQVALFNVGGRLFALSNRCSHARGPLSEGVVEADGERCTVICPWHYAKFDLASGQVVDGIAAAPVPTYTVQVRDGMIWVGRAQ